MDYYIHPSHKDYGDQENHPHVHVCFGSRGDKSTQVSVSLLTCSAIVAGNNVTYRQQKQAEDFTQEHLGDLKKEWDKKSGNDW